MSTATREIACLRFFAFAALSLLALSAASSAYTVRLSIAEVIGSNAKPENITNENNFVSLDYDIMDSGSTGYRLRLRLDVLNRTVDGAEKLLASVWSKEISLWPGERKPVSLYWYGKNITGNLTARARAYRANGIEDVAEIPLDMQADAFSGSRDIFSVEKIRVYDDIITIRLKSAEDAKDVIVYPSKYPLGWLIEQEKIGTIGRNEKKWVAIHYEPALFFESEVTMSVVADSGRYYGEKAFRLKKEAGFTKYLHIAEDLFFS